MSKAWHDRPISAMDTAIFWTEYAARHSNFTFRTAAADVPTYQYLNLDVALIFTAIALCIFLPIWLSCSRTKEGVKIVKSKRKSKRE